MPSTAIQRQNAFLARADAFIAKLIPKVARTYDIPEDYLIASKSFPWGHDTEFCCIDIQLRDPKNFEKRNIRCPPLFQCSEFPIPKQTPDPTSDDFEIEKCVRIVRSVTARSERPVIRSRFLWNKTADEKKNKAVKLHLQKKKTKKELVSTMKRPKVTGKRK